MKIILKNQGYWILKTFKPIVEIFHFWDLKRMRITNLVFLNLIILTIFTGSVFFTSGKFVNATNTPKFYFVAVSLLASITIFVVCHKRIKRDAFVGKTTLWGINIILFLQACYGLSQLVGWLPSNHAIFTFIGSFDNPAGFAAFLATGFPISLFLLIKAKKIEKYLTTIILLVIAIAVFLSKSRTGVLAIIVSSVIFLLFDTNLVRKFRQLRNYKLLITLILACFTASVSVLYHQKKDSANGRLLIWKVSTEIIKDKPVFGHGYGAFKVKYMDYQAGYFKNNPDSKNAQLADNVKHPFNEF
ncbi:MAG: O-antigen ligase family protein, partial [Draconibacterium sp.]